MTISLSRAAAFAAAAVVLSLPAQAAHAADIPDQPALMHLKDYPDLSMSWTDEGAVFTEGGDALWRLTPAESDNPAELEYEGAIFIVHDETGLCLAAEPMADDADAAPVALVECGEEPWWDVLTDTRPNHHDARFLTPEGYMLGAPSNNVLDGQAVEVHDTASSIHAQEWRFRVPEQEPEPEPEPEPSSEAAAPAAQPQLPQTGVEVAAIGGAGLAAVAAGAALAFWWRRRSLRAQW